MERFKRRLEGTEDSEGDFMFVKRSDCSYVVWKLLEERRKTIECLKKQLTEATGIPEREL